MIRWLIGVVIFFTALIVGISLFLTPNNLMNCSDTPSTITGCDKADAVIAISGGDTTARAQKAIDLYQAGWAKEIVFSGAAADTSGPSNAEVMREQALAQGVPLAVIRIEEMSTSTRQNAEDTAPILDEDKVETAILVTSRYHMKRAMLEFQKQAPNVQFRASPVDSDNQWSAVWWWTTPYGWMLAVSELVKIIIFYTGGSV